MFDMLIVGDRPADSPAKATVFTDTAYHDLDGRTVIYRSIVIPGEPADHPHVPFRCRGETIFKRAGSRQDVPFDPQNGDMKIPFEVAIPNAKTLAEAFAYWDSAYEQGAAAVHERVTQQMTRSKLLAGRPPI